MGWAETAEKLIAGAERARLAGDQVAFIALTTKAAECAKIAKLLSEPCLSVAEQKAQGLRCLCRGSDEMCPCQNRPDTETRRQRNNSK